MKKRFFVLSIIAFVFLFNLASISAEKIVLLAIDDFQTWWLEDIQESVVQMHINNNIPATIGVIPSGIEDYEIGDIFSAKVKAWDSYANIEVSQHGYDHVDPMEGMSYPSQYTLVKRGKDLLNSVGISPRSFIPPYGSADLNTVNVLIALGFNTLYTPIIISPDSSDNLLIMQDELLLCSGGNEGPNCVYKDYNSIKSEIDQKIQTDGVALVLYHMQDFDDGGGDFDTYKASQIVGYANHLKQDGYTLMTVEQYYQYLNSNSTQEPVDNDNDGYDSTKDCNDNDAEIHPGASETACNGIDNDCDLSMDENYLVSSTNCGIGQCASTGLLQCISGSQVNSCSPLSPKTETCDGKDNDCDGQTDENLTNTYYRDADADGYGNPSVSTKACSLPSGYVSNSLDCNDNNLAINPGAIEVCDGVDNNCNSQTDEGCSVKTLKIRPNGQGYRTGWTNVNCPSGYNSNEWQCVNDANTETYDYLKNSGTEKETFTFSNTNLNNVQIKSVTLYFYATRNLYSYNSCFEAMIRYGGRDYLSGNQLCVTNSWQYVSHKYTKNPATNLPWTITQVEYLEAGMHSLDPNGGGKISQVYAVVEYV